MSDGTTIAALRYRIRELEEELADWKLGSQVEADAGDEARAENARLREELENERRWRRDAEQAVQEKDSMFTQEWARVNAFNDFWHWAAHGERKGWVSDPVCATHDGIPGTPEENEEWEEGHDPCQHVLRLWGD